MRKERNLWHKLSLCLLSVCLLCGSCGDDTSPEDDGTLLPEGEYPVTFTSNIFAFTASDPSLDGSAVWNTGDEIAVQIGSDVKRYTVESDGKTLSSSEPFYWTSSEETKRVTAWFPYSAAQPEELMVESDQSSEENFRRSDYLVTGTGVSAVFGSNNTLSFSHRMAKVRINLLPSDNVPDIDGATVRLVNLNGVHGGNSVIPHVSDAAARAYTACLVPQDVSRQQFVQVDLSGETYYYLPAEDEGSLVAGKYYVYNVSVTKDGLLGKLEQSGAWEGTDQEVSTVSN